ncbi:MAG: hypothetical protein ACJ8G1_22770 [Vitreoscilla sp.]
MKNLLKPLKLLALLAFFGWNIWAQGTFAGAQVKVVEVGDRDYPSLGAFIAAVNQNNLIFCREQRWSDCAISGSPKFGLFGGGDSRYGVPPAGQAAGVWQTIYPQAHGCSSENGVRYCRDDLSDGWNTFYYKVCPAGQIWATKSDGTSVCAPVELATIDVPGRCPAVGKPIYPLSGVQRHDVDLGISIGGTPLKLTFDSRDQLPDANGATPWVLPQMPSFGAMWQSSFHGNLQIQGASQTLGAGHTSATIQLGSNNNETYSPSGSAFCSGVASAGAPAYTSSVDVGHQLTFSGNAGRLVDQRGLIERQFDASGALVSVSNALGGGLSYAYSSSVTASAPVVGLLTSVSDQFGRTVKFDYEQPTMGGYAPRITTVTAPDGQVTSAAYDPTYDNLVSLTWPDSRAETFLYERSDLPWALTAIVDESNARYVSLGYDTLGRANSSQEGAGANSFSVPYDAVPANAPHWNVSETFFENIPVVCRIRRVERSPMQPLIDPSGQSIVYTTGTANGQPVLLSQSQPAGSGCAASTSSMAYDAAGNETTHDDFNGNRTCYAYDLNRNLKTIVLEGLSTTTACPAQLASYVPTQADVTHPERKTTTSWHPDWALKAKEAEPGKLTTWVYNGQPDPVIGGTASCAPTAPALPDGKPIAVVCARYEQATTDGSGAVGLSAATTGPARAWKYTYNQFGQVLTETTPKLSPTDSLSHTTTYAYYADTNMSGNVGHTIGDLQSITNPLQQTTSFTSYDGAGRLLSSSDPNSVVTTQTYWPRGWLKSQTVTPPGGAAPRVTLYDYWPTGLLKTVTLPDASTLNYAYDDAHRLTDVTDSAGNRLHYVLDNLGNRTSEQISDASGNLASTVSRVFDALNRVQSQTGLAH